MDALTRAKTEIAEKMQELGTVFQREQAERKRATIQQIVSGGWKEFAAHMYNPWTPSILSTDDACRILSLGIKRETQKRGHWSYDANRYSGLKNRLIIARYFRRFGYQLWMKGRCNVA